MAKGTPSNVSENAPAIEDDLTTLMAKANDETEWETVTDEVPTRVVFDTIGDVFIGDYMGEEHIPAEKNITKDKPEGEAFDLYLFRGLDGGLYSINKSTRIEQGMAAVEVGRRTRLQYVKDVRVKDQPSAMKDITVQVAKTPA